MAGTHKTQGIQNELVVSTHLKNISQNGNLSPSRDENKIETTSQTKKPEPSEFSIKPKPLPSMNLSTAQRFGSNVRDPNPSKKNRAIHLGIFGNPPTLLY